VSRVFLVDERLGLGVQLVIGLEEVEEVVPQPGLQPVQLCQHTQHRLPEHLHQLNGYTHNQ
jgi:hypothetical protein